MRIRSYRRRLFVVARNVLIVLVLLIPLLPATAGVIRAQNPVADLPSANADGPTSSQADNLELVGQLGGHMSCIALHGGYAYVGFGPRLIVIDVSDPSHPSRVGETPLLQGVVNGIAIAGDYAYVADGYYGLRVVDVSQPAAPRQVGHYPWQAGQYMNCLSSLTIQGTYVYGLDLYSELMVIDVTDPTAPTGVGRMPTIGVPEAVEPVVAGERVFFARSGALHVVDVADKTNPHEIAAYHPPDAVVAVAVGERFVYVAGEGGLYVVDIADLAAPAEVGTCTFAGVPASNARLAVHGAYAYVALAPTRIDGYYLPGGWLSAVSMADPSQPMVMTSIDTPGEAWDIAIAGDHAYVADGKRGVTVYDLSAAGGAPALAARMPELADVRRVCAAGQYVYAISVNSSPRYGVVYVLDISDPSAPVLVGTLTDTRLLTAVDYDVAVDGGFLYVTNWDSLLIIDVSDPTRPTLASYSPYGGVGLAISGRYLYSGDSRWLTVVDVGDPNRPVIVDICPAPLAATDLWVDGDWLYAAGRGGLSLFNIADPAHPRGMSFLNYALRGTDVAVIGPYAYMSCLTGEQAFGLKIIAVADIGAPASVSAHRETSVQPGAVAVSGRYVYTAEASRWSESGFAVFDISDPTAPASVGLCARAGAAAEMVVGGRYAYVAAGDIWFSELQIIDIADPRQPAFIGEYVTQDPIRALAVAGAYAYILDGTRSLYIVNIADAAHPTLAREYDLGSNGEDVVVLGRYAYVATSDDDSLRVIDMSDPAQPAEISSRVFHGVGSLAIAGDYLYAGQRYPSGYLYIVDVADPAYPTSVSAIRLPARPEQITLAGWHAFVADGLGGVRVLNIADPAHPREVASYITPYSAVGVAVAGENVYVADGRGGLVILKASLGKLQAFFPLAGGR